VRQSKRTGGPVCDKNAVMEIFDTPQLVAPTDFNLADPIENRELAKKLLKKKTELIQDSVDYEIIRSGDNRNGNIALVNKHSNMLDYLVHYAAKYYSHIGETVTQLKLWRRRGSPYVQGITRQIFYSYLLQNYPMIMSDNQQTDDGRKFWLDRMAEATTLGYRVGLANLYTRSVEWFDPAHSTFGEWISNHEQWGAEDSYRGLRYLIAN
jgi:hypothetical protein